MQLLLCIHMFLYSQSCFWWMYMYIHRTSGSLLNKTLLLQLALYLRFCKSPSLWKSCTLSLFYHNSCLFNAPIQKVWQQFPAGCCLLPVSQCSLWNSLSWYSPRSRCSRPLNMEISYHLYEHVLALWYSSFPYLPRSTSATWACEIGFLVFLWATAKRLSRSLFHTLRQSIRYTGSFAFIFSIRRCIFACILHRHAQSYHLMLPKNAILSQKHFFPIIVWFITCFR